MNIIQRHNKYFLQFSTGELELSEVQVKKRIARGDTLTDYLHKLEQEQPQLDNEIFVNTEQSYITSAKYFDYILKEFEQIYRSNKDKDDAIVKLTRFCKNAIKKLEDDRRNPKTDHVVIDYYLLSWNRVISFLETLPFKQSEIEEMPLYNFAPEKKQPAPKASPPPAPKNYTKQLLMIQLMQADGLFPISDAMQGIQQDDILMLIAGLMDVDRTTVKEAIQNSSAILLKRGITNHNKQERIELLEEMEKHFEALPYYNIISRIKLLLKIYREHNNG